MRPAAGGWMPLASPSYAAVIRLALSGVVSLAPAQVPVYRSVTDAVTIDVSVRRGDRPVTGLAMTDFVLTDNGVEQEIVGLTYETLPIDVTVLLDVSGSVSGDTLDMLRRSVADLRSDLRVGDRLRLVVFNERVQRLPLDEVSGDALDAAFAGRHAGGSSAVRDALAVALASPGPADRRQFIALLTDGADNTSITTDEQLLTVARRTRPTVSVLLASPLRRTPSGILADVARETGGTAASVMPSERLGGRFRRVLEQFRSSYVLAYSPQGVPRVGRHTIDVHVRRAGVEVRARRDYVVE